MEYTESSYGSMSQMSTFLSPLMPSTGKNNDDYDDAESSIDILSAQTLYRSSFYSMAMLELDSAKQQCATGLVCLFDLGF